MLMGIEDPSKMSTEIQKFDDSDSGVTSDLSENRQRSTESSIPEIVVDTAGDEKERSVFNIDMDNPPPKPDSALGRWKSRFRFLLATVTLLCLTAIWSNIICFNFALICIDHEFTHFDNATAVKSAPVIFTSAKKVLLTSSMALSALVSNFVIVNLISRYGIRSIFTILGLLSAVATALFPMALNSGFSSTMLLRVIQGIAFASNFPVIGAFTSKWAYHKQNGMIVSMLVASIQLAPTISDPLSGALCGSFLGWQYVFYVHAAWTAVLFTVFGAIYRNNPAKHPLVGDHEFHKVTVNKPIQTKKEMKKIPYKSILQSWSVWAIWVAGVGNFFCVNAIFLYSPNYLHYVLDMDVSSTGAMAAVPAVLQFLVKLSGGTTSDKVKCFTETNKLRVYNSVSFMGSALFFVVLSFIPSRMNVTCFIVLAVAAGFLGLTTGGFFKNGPLLAQQYSHFVTGNISQAIMITLIILPFVMEGLAPKNTEAEWQLIFWVISAVLLVTNVIFCFFCSAEPAEWTRTGTTVPNSVNTSMTGIPSLTVSSSPSKVFPTKELKR